MLDPAVDAGLAKAGWSLEGESVTLVGTPEGAESSDAELTLSVSAEWLAASHAINDRQPSLAAAFDAVLHRLDTPAVFAAVRRDGAIKALCYGALYDGWLCVEAVGAHPAWRRQGLAGMAVSSVMTWGAVKAPMASACRPKRTITPRSRCIAALASTASSTDTTTVVGARVPGSAYAGTCWRRLRRGPARPSQRLKSRARRRSYRW